MRPLSFKPPLQDKAFVAAKNTLLRAFHQKSFNEWQLHVLDDEPVNEPYTFYATFIFDGSHEFHLASARPPFLALLESLAKPWGLNELPPTLAQAMLEEAIARYQAQAPAALTEKLRLVNFSSHAPAAADKKITCQLALTQNEETYTCALSANLNFPFVALSEILALKPHAQTTYPQHLWVEFPMRLGSATLPPATAKTLEQGDIILIEAPTL